MEENKNTQEVEEEEGEEDELTARVNTKFVKPDFSYAVNIQTPIIFYYALKEHPKFNIPLSIASERIIDLRTILTKCKMYVPRGKYKSIVERE